MKNFSHRFKKQFGQNFLKSSRFPASLVRSLDLNEKDFVIEIGPGAGIVTELLLKTGAKVLCVETDYDLIPKLIKKFNESPNFDIVHEDILKFDVLQYIKDKKIDGEIKAVGSLPYNISKKIINKFLELNRIDNGIRVVKMSFIVQEEVAKDYSAVVPKATFLGNVLKLQAKIKKFESIPASQFVPRPKVNGGIIAIEPFENSAIPENLETIIKTMKIGFITPRKKLRNNLMSIKELDSTFVDKVLEKNEISLNSRASEVEIEKWKKISEEIKIGSSS